MASFAPGGKNIFTASSTKMAEYEVKSRGKAEYQLGKKQNISYFHFCSFLAFIKAHAKSNCNRKWE